MSFYIGIDLGTSAVKLILTDSTGAILRTVSKDYPLFQPHPHWSEQNPEDWWAAVCAALEELTAGFDTAEVKGIGVGGQMHGLVMLDENGSVLRPAILWNDTRTGKETAYLNDVVGKASLQAWTGNIAFAGFTAPKILWVKAHEPDVFAKCKKICLPKDYINYRLTGVFATDVSDASGTLYFDVAHRCWSKEMLALLGIDEAMLPAVFESEDVIGTTTLFGLSAAVVAGAGDNAAAAIGTDTVNAGQCNISLGTSGTVFLPTDAYVKTANPALHSFCHANGKWHLMGCILSAASCNKWLNETVLQSDYGIGCGKPENALYFLPYLSGERCPHNDGDVRGAFVGLTHTTTREDLQAAVLEGVSFAIKDCVALCPTAIRSATVCGGGTKSKTWMQMLSNVLGIELHIIENEGPAYGGALLAAKQRHAPLVKYTVAPDPDAVAIYAKKYEKFKQLYPMLKAFYQED
ncbi:MAG: xylulokinase [Clostridia bacterium]|nr:xylulokinase [Clostridia bacterium]